jgi:hypothetical protein
VTQAKAPTVAIIALCVSLATAAFSVLQWWYNQKATKAAAAVEVSKTYMRERDEKQMGEEYMAFVALKQRKDAGEWHPIYENKITFLGWQFNYIVFLVEKGMLDKNYLSPIMKCDMMVTAEIIRQPLPASWTEADCLWKAPNQAASPKINPER